MYVWNALKCIALNYAMQLRCAGAHLQMHPLSCCISCAEIHCSVIYMYCNALKCIALNYAMHCNWGWGAQVHTYRCTHCLVAFHVIYYIAVRCMYCDALKCIALNYAMQCNWGWGVQVHTSKCTHCLLLTALHPSFSTETGFLSDFFWISSRFILDFFKIAMQLRCTPPNAPIVFP